MTTIGLSPLGRVRGVPACPECGSPDLAVRQYHANREFRVPAHPLDPSDVDALADGWARPEPADDTITRIVCAACGGLWAETDMDQHATPVSAYTLRHMLFTAGWASMLTAYAVNRTLANTLDEAPAPVLPVAPEVLNLFAVAMAVRSPGRTIQTEEDLNRFLEQAMRRLEADRPETPTEVAALADALVAAWDAEKRKLG